MKGCDCVENFEEIYNLYFKDVYKYMLAISRNPDIAEEITQETFFNALKGIDKFRGECSLNIWLCRIAKNIYCSHCAKEKRRSEHRHEDSVFSVEDDLIRSETAFELHKRLHNLPEPYKEVFSLRVFGELPFAKIAELFGKTESWARVTYYRAKLKMEDKQDET